MQSTLFPLHLLQKIQFTPVIQKFVDTDKSNSSNINVYMLCVGLT